MLLKQQQQRATHSSAAHTAPSPPRHTTPANHTQRRALVQQQQQRCVRVHSSAEELVVRPTTPAGASSSSSQVDQFSQLKQGIARFYNESSGLWESVWGEHMHHGYYPNGAAPKSNAQAQIDMIDETLRWAGVTRVKAMVDVGCGIGGSSRHISRQFGCTSRGITLSPVQAARANELSAAAGLGDRCSFQVADALQQPFADGSFDLVWSMESGEHMPEKERFVNELCRVAAPGGRIIIVTWCHRVLAPGEAGLKPHEQALLSKICEAYYLPAWCSVADYERLFEANGLQDIRIADWSNEVAPFWGEVVKSAMTGQGIMGLLMAGWTTIKGALVMPMMAQGFKMGLIKFNLISATVPAQKKK